MKGGKLVVVGGGAAGSFAAYWAARKGCRVVLCERMSILAKKVRISGKGRCNLTNSAPIPEFVSKIPGNGKFLYGALSRFSNVDLIRFFADAGIKTKVERGGRVFPVSDRADQVAEVLERLLAGAGVEVLYNSRVSGVELKDGRISGVRLASGKLVDAEAVVLATGGASYPGTGSTGDGYRIAAGLGHTIMPLLPSLVPLRCREPWVRDTSGLTLKNVRVNLTGPDGKCIGEQFGELLFTHFGVSGPTVLTLSRDAAEFFHNNPGKELRLHIDLKPALSHPQLELRVQRDLDQRSRKQFRNCLDDLLPRSLIPVVVSLTEIDPSKPGAQITKAERTRLVGILKDLTLTVQETLPIAAAIVTRGGVSVKEVDPRTMKSRLVEGLYFAGEILDVDGYTGGYNLQAAFSTGYVAGTSVLC